MILVLVVLLGFLVGGLVNRLGTDLPARRAPQLPRCPYCGKGRPWYQWVSLPTYLINKTRCPDCSAPIPVRYPLVELGLGFLFGYLFLRYGLTVI